MPRQRAEPRPYLRAGERRTQLLGAAAALVGRDGLGSLTMAGVAAEAGVSRQWVYEHFTDLGDLYRALVLDRFASLDADIDAGALRLSGAELAEFAARRLFALAPADRRILRALVDGAGWNRPELAGIESDLRERILGRWTGFVGRSGRHDPEIRAVIWAIVNAAFGLADQVERQELGVEAAIAILGQLVGVLDVVPVGGRRMRRHPARADVLQPHRTGASHAH